MKPKPISFDDSPEGLDGFSTVIACRAGRIGARLLHEVREALPPPIFFLLVSTLSCLPRISSSPSTLSR